MEEKRDGDSDSDVTDHPVSRDADEPAEGVPHTASGETEADVLRLSSGDEEEEDEEVTDEFGPILSKL